MASSPNVLYFVCHDLGRHLGCYGLPVFSPNIDRFAAEAMRFDQAFCSSPACSPSRVCAMTGMYAHVSGGVGLAHMGWPLKPEVQTIVDYLNAAGYETAHAGMQHERAPGANRYAVDLDTSWASYNIANGVDRAVEWLKTRDRSKPFYLNVGSQEPHPSTWGNADKLYGGAYPPDEVYVPPYMPDVQQTRTDLGKFQAAIRYMDTHFGRLLDGLKEAGYDRDTIVVFTTDHGINNRRGKGTLYDAGMEIALLVRMPDRSGAGQHCRALIQNIDFVPTLLEAAAAPPRPELPGKSFLPLLQQRPYTPHTHIFTERNFHGETRYYGKAPANGGPEYVDRYDPVRSIRTEEYHYIQYFDPGIKPRAWMPWEIEPGADTLPVPTQPRPAESLYHVAKDPMEIFDLAQKPEFQAIKAELAAKLHAWMAETNDFILRDETPAEYAPKGMESYYK